jgi:hypothetical protein
MTGEIVIVLIKWAVYAYGVESSRQFLIKWLETRAGLPLFNTVRLMKREELIDAIRSSGLVVSERS